MNMIMNRIHGMGLKLTTESPSVYYFPVGSAPPTEHFIGTQIQPEPKEKVVINPTTSGNDHSLRPIDVMNTEMDMNKSERKDMDHGKLCPLCKSDCPSKLFMNFPLELKDPTPTPITFQENVKPFPETPKPVLKISRYMTRTPQVKRKMNGDFENH